MTISLDTNCLLQIVPRTAKHRWLYDLIKEGRINLAITTEILAEYEEQLSAFYSPVVATGVLKTLELLDNVIPTNVHFRWRLIVDDPDDNKFSDCAFASNSDYLVTYDRHFRILKEVDFPKIITVNLEQLAEIISYQSI
jgi:uncharacterized protein